MSVENLLIIGACGDIGKELVRELCCKFCIIAVCRSLPIEKDICDNTIYIEFDVCNLDEIDSLVDDIANSYGSIKSVIYAAGLQIIKPVKLMVADECKKQFDVNYFAPFFFAKAFAKKKNHSGQNSSIIFVSSIAGNKPEPGIVNYSASKSALNTLTKGLARELKGIRVNSVSPSFLITNMTKAFPKVYSDKAITEIDKLYPLGIGSVDDVVNLVVFLLSEKSMYITGSILNVDGGASII